MPEDLFQDMQKLSFIHIANHVDLKQIPSLRGLRSLRVLSLAAMLSLTSLPALGDLESLERIVLALVPSIPSISDMAPLKRLKSFIVAARSSMCCNGFRNVPCDLSDFYCAPPRISPPVCLSPNRTDAIASEATLEAFARFTTTVCAPVTDKAPPNDPFTAPALAKCEGKLFTKCQTFRGDPGMCYTLGIEPAVCITSPAPVEMRRRQIRDGVGAPCRLPDEAWLGCV